MGLGMKECCEIFGVFDEQNNLIKEYDHWKLLIRNRNTTLGNCVAITKRHMESFSDITLEEMQDFSHVVKDIEKALKSAFSYDQMNYLMLMMKDKHTHFHIIPRYSSEKEFAGITWGDKAWPRAEIYTIDPVSQEVLNEVKEKIKENL
jgi:diadenosine tetraphosphate (Ap4A) HIT family hydrolase